VDVEELDRRHRTVGWLTWDVTNALVEQGHVDVLQREAGAGDFSCADALGRLLRSRGELAAALDVYRPYAEAGWWVAVECSAAILEEQGSLDAAIGLVRPLAEAGDRLAVCRLAELLARQGRIDEVFALLVPCLASGYGAARLVELTAGRSRDGEVLAVLRPLVTPDSLGFQSVLAELLERMGRVDEAVTLLLTALRGGRSYYVNHAKQIADILARHDPARLADFAAGDGRECGAHRLARLFEE
jgi:tetratricopeptide (TPR) repeat protein